MSHAGPCEGEAMESAVAESDSVDVSPMDVVVADENIQVPIQLNFYNSGLILYNAPLMWLASLVFNTSINTI